jgi:DNA polymerase elongation subunit (family B)
LSEFRTLSPVARAASQLQGIGSSTSPGERVRFIYTRGEPGVHAWNLPQPPNPAAVDVQRYSELLVRAAAEILGPFGVNEDLLRQWLFSNAAYGAPPGEITKLDLEGAVSDATQIPGMINEQLTLGCIIPT